MADDKAPEWIAQAANRSRVWDNWTDEQKDQVLLAIRWRNEYPCSAEAVADRISSLGGSVSSNTVNRYCREVLGRRSLARP